MDFYGCHFEYAGELSRKYGLIIACIETKRNLLLAGKNKSVSVFSKRNNTRYSIGSVYADAPLTFDMEVVSEEPIEGEWRRKIQKWLFHQTDYQKLYLDRSESCFSEPYALVNGEPKRMYLNCKFVNPQKIEGCGGIMGYKFSVECDSRMAWQDPMVVTNLFDGGAELSSNILIRVDTDAEEYTYPKVSIRTGEIGGSIVISNITDDKTRLSIFKDVPANTDIVVNGAYNYVTENYYENFSSRNFPRLLDGENIFSVNGDVVSIEIQWQNMRYL